MNKQASRFEHQASSRKGNLGADGVAPGSSHPEADSRGFTILLAALVSSVVLALGVAVFQIAYKQLTLSSIGRDSQHAFYAADTGAECALYWDARFDYFASPPPTIDAFCGGGNQPLSVSGRGTNSMSFEFEPQSRCVRVRVTKSDTHPRTVIVADGYSAPCLTILENPRTLQRTIRIQY